MFKVNQLRVFDDCEDHYEVYLKILCDTDDNPYKFLLILNNTPKYFNRTKIEVFEDSICIEVNFNLEKSLDLFDILKVLVVNTIENYNKYLKQPTDNKVGTPDSISGTPDNTIGTCDKTPNQYSYPNGTTVLLNNNKSFNYNEVNKE